MLRVSPVAIGVLLFAHSRPSLAAPEERPWSVGLSLGYSFPVGSLEEASRVSDTTYGLVAVAPDVAYRIDPRLGIFVRGSYGVGVPTLCASASDCQDSLGSDVQLILGSRFSFERAIGRRFFGELGLGYEWYASTLSDEGVESTRRYRGALFSTRAGVDFGLGKHFSLGPIVDVCVGELSHSSFESPGVDRSGRVDGAAVHGWITLGLRAAIDP